MWAVHSLSRKFVTKMHTRFIRKLGLNEMFSQIQDIEPLMNRIRYMESFMKDKDAGKGEFVLSLVYSLFS
ncbi:ribonucleotide reductase [Actinobacillus equuli]|nr:ribonucleotide reductase [Actinobacillus equuli]